MMMYQQQPMGMGYGYAQPPYYGGGGYSQSRIPAGAMQGPASPVDKAPVLCNCCNCTHNGCAKFWVIYNSIQVVLCFLLLITEAILGKIIQDTNSNSTLKGSQNHGIVAFGPCVEHLLEDSIKYTKLSILIILLLIYTAGSILFSLAVFMKTLDAPKRAKFLMIYTATIACFPLAYVIPFLIDLCICSSVALRILLFTWWWFLVIFISTGLAFNIVIVYRKWIMKPNIAVIAMPQPQQQIISQQSSEMDYESSGMYEDSDSDN